MKVKRACYFCGEPNADSKDHIPSRGIFPKKPQGQLITVPAHKGCNESFHKDDELFRNIIISGCYESEKGRKAWDDQVVASWDKNPGAKKDLRDLLFTVFINDPISGKLVPKEAIRLDVKLFERQVKRWAKGLFYHRFKEPLSDKSGIIVEKLLPPEISLRPLSKYFLKIGMRPKWIHVEPNVFSYFHASNYQYKNIGFIIFVFFNTEVYTASIN